MVRSRTWVSISPIIRGVKPAVHELAVAGVVGRIHLEHEVPAGGSRLLLLRRGRLLDGHHATPSAVGGEGRGVPVAVDDVGVLADHPEAGAVRLGVVVDGVVLAEPGEPLVRDGLVRSGPGPGG